MPAILYCFLLLVFLNSCSFLQPAREHYTPAGLPTEFSGAAGNTTSKDYWWQEFNNPELTKLVETALANNFSILEAGKRLDQARQVAIKGGADSYPAISGSGSGSSSESYHEDSPNVFTGQWSLGISASYEIDLWGRVKAGKDKALLQSLASGEDLKTAIISVSSAIGESWFSIISARKQRQLLAEQLILQHRLLELLQVRFNMGKTTSLEIYQQQIAIEKIKTAIIPLVAREQLAIRQLALLCGQTELAGEQISQQEFPALTALPEIGLPVDLLANRPDVKAAFLQIKASEKELIQARAGRLPALKLTASQSYSADELKAIFDNWLVNLAGNITAPIFDGNRLRAEAARVASLVEERVLFYHRTVYTAVQEVEDNLTRERQYRESLQALDKQLQLTNRLLDEALNQYVNGSSNFINLLTTESQIIQIHQDIITTQEKLLAARVNLHKALGGTWPDKIIGTASSPAENPH